VDTYSSVVLNQYYLSN